MDTSRTAWILAALEDCVVLGVDVINMSIGTACGFSRESDEEKVDGIYDKTVNIVRFALLFIGVGILIYGYFAGGTADVLTKAINICTECIGLG